MATDYRKLKGTPIKEGWPKSAKLRRPYREVKPARKFNLWALIFGPGRDLR